MLVDSNKTHWTIRILSLALIFFIIIFANEFAELTNKNAAFELKLSNFTLPTTHVTHSNNINGINKPHIEKHELIIAEFTNSNAAFEFNLSDYTPSTTQPTHSNDVNGIRKPHFHPMFFHSQHIRWKQESIPIITTIIVNGSNSSNIDSIKFFFVTKHINYGHWSNADWYLQSKKSEPIVQDTHQHTLFVEWKNINVNSNKQISLEIISKQGTKTAKKLMHRFSFDNTNHQFYENLTLVNSIFPNKPIKNGIGTAMCTMVKEKPVLEVMEWIIYHQIIGFESIIIYIDDSDFEKYDSILSKIENVYLIPFDTEIQDGWFYQQIQQNDCIHRFRNVFKWIALTDMDEYFYIMNESTTLMDILAKYEKTSIGGLRINSWYFSSYEKRSSNSSELIIDEYIWRLPQPHLYGHEKVIVNPLHVEYFSVHTITVGNKMHLLDPYNDIRMQHYKHNFAGYPSEGAVQDTRIRDKYARKIKEQIKMYT